MTLLGWIITSFLGVGLGYFIYRLTVEIHLNKKLRMVQKSLGEVVPKVKAVFWVKRSYSVILTVMLMMTTVFSGAFDQTITFDQRILKNAKPVLTADTIRSLLSSQYYPVFGGPRAGIATDMIENTSADNRDYIGTNNQIQNVEEADIVKTDGNYIYYAARYQNILRVFHIGNYGFATLSHEIDLNNLYVDSMFLTDEYLIVIGYTYDVSPYIYDSVYDFGWRYMSYTGTVKVFDRETFDVVYTLETDGNFYQYRLIEDALYLVSNKYIHGNNDELRPYFKTTEGQTMREFYLDYDEIYYFDNVPVYSMTVLTGINLNTFDITSEAFLGYVNQIFATENTLYTAFSYTKYYSFLGFTQGYYTQTQIIKFSMDHEKASLTYIGQGVVDGYIENQYWMDEYQDDLRVVTTASNPVINRLFVLRESKTTDDLIIIGSITEGLGKPDEKVYSVDFQNDKAFVVTFQIIDPRYWIDLSNPRQPRILKATERPGFATYMHIWNEAGSQTVNIGYTADSSGRIIGMELSATDDSKVDFEDSYVLPYQSDDRTWTYAYSEAIYNPKALMVSPRHGIIAFPVSSYRYTRINDVYTYSYVNQYLVFYINFDAVNKEDIISSPIIINHPQSERYFNIERGVYISESGDNPFELIYTFSNLSMISFDLKTQTIYQTITYNVPNDDK